MKENDKTAVRQVLTDYLNENHLRKTPERFAVLDAVYTLPGHFTMQQLEETMEEQHFRVSKATLYNTLNLLLRLRLVVCFRLNSGVVYMASYANEEPCRQICTVCGKVTAVKAPAVAAAIDEMHLKRFRKEDFALYVFGTCSSCQAKITRQKNKTKYKNEQR